MATPIACNWSGVFPAATTQFDQSLNVDLAATQAVQAALIRDGVHGMVVLGTVGENNSLSADEKRAVLKAAVETSGGKVPIITGVSELTTPNAIAYARDAERLGADGLMVLPAMVYVPSAAELEHHFRTVAQATSLPIMLYNNPPAYRVNIDLATLGRLAQVPNIVGLKDATGNMERGAELLRRAPRNFAVYSGDDGTGLALLMLGAHGVISVTANVAPRMMQELCAAVFAGDLARARSHNNKLLGLHRQLFVEANPIPVKWVLQQMGQMEGGIRLPLTPLSSSFHDLLRGAMEQADIGAAVAMPAMAK